MSRKRNTISENQLSLPFSQIGVGNISYNSRAILFWFVVAISLISFALYIYGINSTARYIAERQYLEKRVAEISAELDTLEFAYIELKNSITMDLAYQHGFKEVRSPLYVSRDSQSALSFNTIDR